MTRSWPVPDAELAESTVTGEWEPHLRNYCNPAAPEPCDCGFVGHWEWRTVHCWAGGGGKRSDWLIRRDIERGHPPRPNDEGAWLIVGFDERCPGCGDIERFAYDDARLVRTFSEPGKVLVYLDARRPQP